MGWLQHWNVGHCRGKAAADGWDDVGFVAEVIQTVHQRFEVDPRRIFLAGMSNGGMLAYRFAAERGEQLAAVAVVAGAIGSRSGDAPVPWRLPAPSAPLPVLIVHGTGDRHIPYAGGISPLKGGDRVFASVAEATEFWREANGCVAPAHTETRRGGAVEETRWSGCSGGQPVVLYTLQGWGHAWPAPHFTAGLSAGEPLRDLNATTLLWEFFRDPEGGWRDAARKAEE